MAAPFLVNASATVNAGGTASLVQNMPASIVAGRLLLGLVYAQAVPSGLSGFTPIPGATVTTSTWTMTAYAKVAVGSDTSTATLPTSQPIICLIGQYDAWSGNIADIVAVLAAAGDPPLCNPGSVKDWLYVATQAAIISGTGAITTAPSGYSHLASSTTGGATSGNVSTADRAVTASSEDPPAFTATGSPALLIAGTFAIPPVAPTAGAPAQPIVMPSAAAMQASTW